MKNTEMRVRGAGLLGSTKTPCARHLSLQPEQKYFADARVSTPAVLPRGVVSNPGSWRSRVSLHDIQEKCRRERIVRLATAS